MYPSFILFSKFNKIDIVMCFLGRATQWAFPDGLSVNPKADPEIISLAILVFRQEARPFLCKGIIDRELGRHCTRDIFYMHQVSLGYIVIFRQRRASNRGPPVSSPKLYRPGYHSKRITKNFP